VLPEEKLTGWVKGGSQAFFASNWHPIASSAAVLVWDPAGVYPPTAAANIRGSAASPALLDTELINTPV
jgi:hypothetical protein